MAMVILWVCAAEARPCLFDAQLWFDNARATNPGEEWDKLTGSIASKIKHIDVEIHSVNTAGAFRRWQEFMSRLSQRYYPSLGWPMPFKMREYVLLYSEIEDFNRETQEMQVDTTKLTNIFFEQKQLNEEKDFFKERGQLLIWRLAEKDAVSLLQEKVASFDEKYILLLHALSELLEFKSYVKKIDDFIVLCEKIWAQDYFGSLTQPFSFVSHTYGSSFYASERRYKQGCKALEEYRAAVTTQNFSEQLTLLHSKQADALREYQNRYFY